MADKQVYIDFHAHVLDPYVFDIAASKNVMTGFGMRPATIPEPHVLAMTEPQRQVAVMDERGIDKHVISSPTVIQGTAWADPQTDLTLCRHVNDTIAGWVERYPDRFIGSFVLPLQDLALAIPEMRRCVETLGLRVANLPTNVQGHYLGHASLTPMWEAIDEMRVVAYIHPDGVKDPWFQDYALWNSLGQSIEETKAMASLIYEGTMDRFPAVPMIMAHGGGYFPHYMGRLDRNVTNMPFSTKNITGKPSDYLRRFYYDTCVYEPQVMRSLIDRVGVERLVMGSDFPVNMADPKAFLSEQAGLSNEDLATVGGGVASGIFQAR